MVTNQTTTGMLLVAIACLQFGLQPSDLELMAHQLAEFDAVNDSRTEMNNVTSD